MHDVGGDMTLTCFAVVGRAVSDSGSAGSMHAVVRRRRLEKCKI